MYMEYMDMYILSILSSLVTVIIARNSGDINFNTAIATVKLSLLLQSSMAYIRKNKDTHYRVHSPQ